jgi:hypothetical protein
VYNDRAVSKLQLIGTMIALFIPVLIWSARFIEVRIKFPQGAS